MSGPGTRVRTVLAGPPLPVTRMWRDEEWDESLCGSCGQVRPVVKGGVLRAERERWGLNTEQVAHELKISAGYLREMERGQSPPTEEVMDFYQRLGSWVAMQGEAWRARERARKAQANSKRYGRARR